ncbi:MAG: Calx-beta domain-containing protein, partial [Burkholderiaceae bacterium]
TGTILDNDLPVVSVSGPMTYNEAAGSASYTVTLSNPSSTPVTVAYATADGTATAGSDYTATAGTLTFAPGTLSQLVTVAILNDTVYESAETFTLNLATPVGASLGNAASLTTIVDDGSGTGGNDNDTPSLAVSSPSVSEGAGFAMFTVSLSNPSTAATTVSLATTPGTATAGADYLTALEVSTDGGATWHAGSTATIAAGATSVLVRAPIVDDTIDEFDESFSLVATRTAGTTTNASATGIATIVDNDATPALAINDVTVNEAAGTATFTVTLSAASGLPVTVAFNTTDGSATAGSDYTASAGTLTFAPGVVSQTVTVPIINDAVYEGAETFSVDLTAPVNAVIGDGQGIGTILDNGGGGGGGTDDDRPQVTSVSSPTVVEGGNLDFTINLSNASTTPTTVTLTPASGSATLGTDTGAALVSFDNGASFTAIAGNSVSVPAGSSGFIVRIPTIDDVLTEPTETMSLGAATNVNPNSVVGIGTILDNDSLPEGRDAVLVTAEDTPITLTLANFVMNDAEDGNNVAPTAVRIDSLPASGQLLLGGVAVSAGQLVAAAAISAGQLTFVPAADESGAPYANFTFSVRDSSGLFDPVPNVVTVSVTPVNDAPVGVADSAVAVEAGGLNNAVAGVNPTGNVLGNDTDVDIGDTKTVAAVTGISAGIVGGATAGAYGSLQLNADGSYTYTLDNDLAAVQALRTPANTLADTFTYSVRDTAGATSSTTLTVTIQGTNDAPVAQNDSGSVFEGATLTTTAVTGVLANDTDVDAGDSKTVLAVAYSGSAGAVGTALVGTYGTLTLNADGSYSYAASRPAADLLAQGQIANESFSYTMRDAAGATSSATLSFTITGTNSAPIANADIYTVVEGSTTTPGNVLVNDTDIDGPGTLSVAVFAANASGAGTVANGSNTVTTALGGKVTMNADGGYTYVAPVLIHDAANTPIADSFVYRATDGITPSGWTTVTLNVTDTNPTALHDGATVVFGGTVASNLLANDVAVDGGKTLVSVQFDGVTHAIAPTGNTVITTPDGTLTVSADGSYSYHSNLPATAVVTGTSVTQWQSQVGVYGFNNGDGRYVSGGNLNTASFDATAQALIQYAGGSKPGISVGNKGIDNGEHMVIDLRETVNSATLFVAQMNQVSSAFWTTYDANGVQVGTGDFLSAGSNGSSTEYALTISNTNAFSYIVLTYVPGVNNSQGFVVQQIAFARSESNHGDLFNYTMRDADGDLSSSTLDISVGSANAVLPSGSLRDGTAGNDNLVGTAADDVLMGRAGADILQGGDGNDRLYGGDGADQLFGGNGNDVLYGGAGNDLLTGGLGGDTFAWSLADRGLMGAPAVDTITDFNVAQGDVLDLRDLLVGATPTPASLSHYLDINFSGGDTVIRVSSTGGFAGGVYAASAEDQEIVLKGVDLGVQLGLGAGASEAAMLNEMVSKGKLLTEP